MWDKLTEPPAAIHDSQRRHNARLLASLLVMLVPLAFAVAVVFCFLLDPAGSYSSEVDVRTAAGGTVLWIAAYVLCRFGRYELAIWLALAMASTIVFGVAIHGDSVGELNYLVMPVLLSSLLLPARGTVLFVVVNLAAMMLIPVLEPRVSPSEIIVGPLSFLLIGSALILLITRHRDRLERERRIELAESEARYRSLFEITFEGIAICEDGVLLDANRGLARMFGYRLSEIMGTPFLDLVAQESRAPLAQKIEAEISQPYETRGLKKDGTTFQMEVLAKAETYHGRPVRVIAARDITGRKRAEQEIEERRLYLEGVLAAVPDAIVTLDTRHRVVVWNPGAERIFGYSPQEAVGRDLDDLITNAETYEEAVRYTRMALNRQPVGPTEAVRYRKDGSPVSVILAGSPIVVRDELVGLVAVYTDITRRKRVEEEIRQRTAQLEALREVELELTAQLDLDTLLNSIVARAVELLEGTAGGVYLYRPDRDVLEWGYVVGPSPVPAGSILQRGEGISGLVWETGQPFAVEDYQRWSGRVVSYEGLPLEAVAAAPVEWKEEFLGVLIVESNASFSPADAELLSLFATPVAIAIRNARLFEEAQRRALEQETLREAALALTTTLDRNEVVERILAQLQQVVPYDTASVQLLRAGHLEIVGGRGFPNLGELLGVTFDPQSRDNPNREVVRTRAPFIVEDAPAVYRGFRRPPHAPAGIRSWLGVPMLVGERLIGMIALDKREPGFYTPEQARLAEAFAAQAAVAIENSRLFQAEREQRELAEALEKAAAAVSGTLDLEVVLDRILEQVARVVAGDAFNIMFIEDDLVRAVRWRGYENLGVEEEIAVFSIPITRYPCFVRMMKTQEPLLVPETTTDPNWVQVEGWEWLRSYVAAPILVRGETVGFLDVDSAQPGKFRSADLRCLRAFADHAAAAIENARLYQETAQRLAQTEVLREMMLAAASTLDFDQVLDRTIEVLERAMGVEYLDFMLPDEDGRFMKSHPSILGFTPPPEGCFRFPTDQCVTGRVFRTGEPVLLTDVREAPDYAVADEKVRSELAVPVKIGTETVAVLNLESRQPAAFDEQDLAFYVAVAGQLGVAMHNARLYQQLHDYAGKLETRVEERTAELQAQYARLDAILSNTTDGIVVTDAVGEIVQANPVAQTWLTRALSPEEAARLRESIKDISVRAGECPVELLELTGLDLELSGASILEPGSEEKGAVVAIHDVSHLKALDRMKTRFVSNISHELRTPVTTIKLYAHLMQQQPERWKEYLTSLIQEANHQARLVEDILQVSRIDAGRLEMKPRPIHLDELVEVVFVSRQHLAQEHGLTLELRRTPPGPVALVDPDRMMQALNNLVENAIRYTSDGGSVTISSGIGEAQGRRWATVAVSDTGMGIPEDELPFIFDRFFRGERPREMQLPGTGLGLAIAREIVELHGGWVTVESELEVGSTFTIWLPLVNEDEEAK